MLKNLYLKLPPSVIALVVQLAAFFFATIFLHLSGQMLPPLAYAILSGGVAAVLSYVVGLARWWLLIQFLFVPTLVFMLRLNLPSWIYLAAFLLMLLVYWSTFRTQVPLYLSSKKVWRTLEDLLPQTQTDKRFSFMDIGSGMGGVLTHLAAARPDGQYFGIENAPLPYLLSLIKIKLGNHSNCKVLWGNLWACDLACYDIVFAYLSPVPMSQLWQKVKNEMRPGTLFVSNSFPVSQHPPQYTITLDDSRHSTLYIWNM